MNELPIGTAVRYFPFIHEKDNFIDTVTRSVPFEAESGDLVVMIKGKSGFVSMKHIQQILPIKDPLLDEAKAIILENKKASVSLLQRKMRVGYTRAARLVDLMIEDGFCARSEDGTPGVVLVFPETAYASTCSVCGEKYFGNGYNETQLPCPACLKKQQAASIKPSQWYLVRKDRSMQPWAHYVYAIPFNTATLADTYAELHALAGYHPVHGFQVQQYQEDESAGLAQVIYLEVAK